MCIRDRAQGLKDEEIEALSDQWYEEFNHTPNAQLGGLTPCEYYTQYDGPTLLELAWDYWEEGEELPGLSLIHIYPAGKRIRLQNPALPLRTAGIPPILKRRKKC